MRRRAQVLLTLTLLLLDVSAIALAFYAAYRVTFAASPGNGPMPDLLAFAPMILTMLASLVSVYFFLQTVSSAARRIAAGRIV